MKNKKTVIILSVFVLIIVLSMGTMAVVGRKGAGSSVAAAQKYIESSMRYDSRGMAYVASDSVRQQLYNTGEIPTPRELIKALNKSYDGVPTGYEGKNITFTVADEKIIGDRGYVSLHVYVDGVKHITHNCVTVKIGGRWYYDGVAAEGENK